MHIDNTRLGEIIRACYQALAYPHLDPRVRDQIERILLAAQAEARRKLAS